MPASIVDRVVEAVADSIRRHVAHGHGEIKIQIRPGSIRVQEGKGYIFEVGK